MAGSNGGFAGLYNKESDEEGEDNKAITLMNCGYLETLKKDDYGEGERKKDPYFNFSFDALKWRLYINKSYYYQANTHEVRKKSHQQPTDVLIWKS